MAPHSTGEERALHHATVDLMPVGPEHLFHSLLEQSAVGVALINAATGRIVAANQRCGDIVGVSQTDLITTPLSAFIHPEEVPILIDQVEALKAGQIRTMSLEHRCSRPDGSIVWVALRLSSSSDSGLSPTVFLAIIEDITERKQVEEALRASEVKFRALSDATVMAIFVYQHNRFLYANPAAVEISGYTIQELQSMPLWEIVYPEFRDQAKARLVAVERGDQVPPRLEIPILRKDGETRWLDFTAATILIDSQSARIGSAYDITERRQAEGRERARLERVIRLQEGQLRLSRHTNEDLTQDLRMIVKVTAETIGVERVSLWFFNGDRSALVCRELYRRSLGAYETEPALEVSHYPAYFSALDRVLGVEASSAISDNVTKELAETYLHPLGIASMLDAPVRRDGQTVGVLCCEHVGEPRMWTSEETSFVASAADHVALSFTAEDHRKATEALQDAYHRLQILGHEVREAEENERRRLSRELHDEFGQLLSVLKFTLSATERDLRKEATKTASLAKQVKGALETVDQLFVSLQGMVAALRPAVLEQLGLIAAIKALAAEVVTPSGVRCRVIVKQTGLPKVFAPAVEGALYRITQELMTNVVRHAKATVATITLSCTEGKLKLVVQDNGRGFTIDKVQSKGRFGLQGIRERVELLGGTVEAHSRPGRTAVMVCVLLESPPLNKRATMSSQASISVIAKKK